MASSFYIIPALIIVVFFLASAVRVLREYERGVTFRLGRLIAAKGPGIILLIPVVDRMVKVSLRTLAMEVPPQDVITRDNVSVTISSSPS
jgi:regulator of protease activity HflC (stomatin/prohibitin superfamily)